MKKIHEFKDYLKDYLMMYYGIKSITQKTFNLIVEVIRFIYNLIEA